MLPQREINILICKLHDSYPFYAHSHIFKGEPLQSILSSQHPRHNFALENMLFLHPQEME